MGKASGIEATRDWVSRILTTIAQFNRITGEHTFSFYVMVTASAIYERRYPNRIKDRTSIKGASSVIDVAFGPDGKSSDAFIYSFTGNDIQFQSTTEQHETVPSLLPLPRSVSSHSKVDARLGIGFDI